MVVISWAVRILMFGTGVWLVARTLMSAVRTFVVPRAEPDVMTRFVFRVFRTVFDWFSARQPDFAGRDRVLSFYAPVTLVSLPIAYLTFIQIGFTGMFWAAGVTRLQDAFLLSGSSLLTLGFARVDTLLQTLLAFSEATFGLVLIATLIAYLPTIYGAFSAREKMVALLDIRAGSPPSAAEMYARFSRLDRLGELAPLWEAWEEWFAELDESHTSLAALVFFRSPNPRHSWVTAAGAVLDAAALRAAALDLPRDVRAEMCIRAGYLALRHIVDFFGIEYSTYPTPESAAAAQISVTREMFDELCGRLEAANVPLKADRDEAWRNFHGWRVNYDEPLNALARLVVAPPAPWIGEEQPL